MRMLIELPDDCKEYVDSTTIDLVNSQIAILLYAVKHGQVLPNKEIEGYLGIEQVADLVGVSCQTLNRWYAKQRNNPEDPHLKQLPCYVLHSNGNGRVRLWPEDAVSSLIAFKESVTKGRCGTMGKFKGRGTKNE